jgi:hypothetical protein
MGDGIRFGAAAQAFNSDATAFGKKVARSVLPRL